MLRPLDLLAVMYLSIGVLIQVPPGLNVPDARQNLVSVSKLSQDQLNIAHVACPFEEVGRNKK